MATKALELLIDEFARLPGIGRKSAQRLAFHVMDMRIEDVERFSEALKSVKENIVRCKVCGNISEDDVCEICADEEREHNHICVVEETRDVLAMEKTRFYKGTYHVLNGKISPLNGIKADDLNIKSLIGRIAAGGIDEVILALNPDLEGETTAIYLARMIKPFDIKVTKIASGIPMGGNIEFADIATIAKSIQGRYNVE